VALGGGGGVAGAAGAAAGGLGFFPKLDGRKQAKGSLVIN